MRTSDLAPGCSPCDQQATSPRPPREEVLATNHWRVAHAFNSALPGWLILLPTRHIAYFAELTAAEAQELGGVIRRLSAALEVVTGCVKTYLMQFSEAEGFGHLHLHLVPRSPTEPREAMGPAVFTYLTSEQAQWILAEELAEIANSIRAAIP
ncbi:HIT family hydrolase [Intrasporangium oryzae NRRL B-24470]|uniref:HIT family hydrolase n=1 Tax=Intrasporangium oryzae NRRL B-24470 TaxID=1386089 RepID=W9GFC2_9MICO|nr:HIT family hydrolase [Intrasporangium oryzae NRRL B-24470]